MRTCRWSWKCTWSWWYTSWSSCWYWDWWLRSRWRLSASVDQKLSPKIKWRTKLVSNNLYKIFRMMKNSKRKKRNQRKKIKRRKIMIKKIKIKEKPKIRMIKTKKTRKTNRKRRKRWKKKAKNKKNVKDKWSNKKLRRQKKRIFLYCSRTSRWWHLGWMMRTMNKMCCWWWGMLETILRHWMNRVSWIQFIR